MNSFSSSASSWPEKRPGIHLPYINSASFLLMDMDQYGAKSALVLVAWIGGLAGLFFSARRNKFTRLLVVVQLAVIAVMLWGGESGTHSILLRSP